MNKRVVVDGKTYIDCTPTDEGFAQMALMFKQQIIRSQRSAKQEQVVTEQLESVEQIAAYLAVEAYKAHVAECG